MKNKIVEMVNIKKTLFCAGQTAAFVAGLVFACLTLGCINQGNAGLGEGVGEGGHSYVCDGGVPASGKAGRANVQKCASCDGLHRFDIESDTCIFLRSFVAVGDNGTILQSVDGINWLARNSNTGTDLLYVAYKRDTGWVALGEDSRAYYSRQGYTWTGYDTGSIGGNLGLTGNDETFVIVASTGNGDKRAYWSEDGVNWTLVQITPGSTDTSITIFPSKSSVERTGRSRRPLLLAAGGGVTLAATEGTSFTPVETAETGTRVRHFLMQRSICL